MRWHLLPGPDPPVRVRRERVHDLSDRQLPEQLVWRQLQAAGGHVQPNGEPARDVSKRLALPTLRQGGVPMP